MALRNFSSVDLVHAHRVDGTGERTLVEDTDDDLLAVDGRQERDTQIDFLARHADAEAAVLRDAAFSDVQTGEDLDARGDGELQALGRTAGLDEIAVEPVAQAHAFLGGLDVDVARAVLQGLDEDQIDDADHRAVLAVSGEAVEVDFLALLALDLDGVAGRPSRRRPSRPFSSPRRWPRSRCGRR